MKIFGMSLPYVIAAIIIGLVLSFGVGFLMVPRPVDVHKVEITPVPTPAPVYIEPTTTQEPSPVQTQTMTPEEMAASQAVSEVTDMLVATMPLIVMMVIIGVMLSFFMQFGRV